VWQNLVDGTFRVLDSAPSDAPKPRSGGGKKGGYSKEERQSIERQTIIKSLSGYLQAVATAEGFKKSKTREDMLLASQEFFDLCTDFLAGTDARAEENNEMMGSEEELPF
jgi:hypothetical protein